MENLRNLELSVSKNFDKLLDARKNLLKNDKGLSGGD